MKLDILVERENINQTIVGTLEKYFNNQYDWKGTILVKNRSNLKTKGNILFSNGKINILYSRYINRIDIYSVTKEYIYNKNIILHIIQYIYVKYSCTIPCRYFTSKINIDINPWIKFLDNCIIIPGNHSLRIIDLNKENCIVLLKNGFNKDYFLREIKIRKYHDFISSPDILVIDYDNNFYIEKRINGISHDRLNAGDKIKTFKKSLQILFRLYYETKSECQIDDWISSRYKIFKDNIDKLPHPYTSQEKNKIINIFNIITKKALTITPNRVTIADTHGDFQGSNIILDFDKTYLIDWEYTNRRYVLYDIMVYITHSRNPKKLCYRILELLKNKSNYTDILRIDKYNILPKEISLWMVLLFLIDDIILRIEEICIPTLKKKSLGLQLLVNECNKIINLDIFESDNI